VSEKATGGRIYYTSRYRHGVDEKRRVQIPAKWRPAEGEVEFTLIVWRKGPYGPCLRALPPEQMERLMQAIDAMPNEDPRKTVLKRVIGSHAEQVTVDRAGRIVLPEAMAREAGIEKEALFVGLLDRFEIWSPERYAAVEAADKVLLADAMNLLE
jgi:MraZ protein